MASLDWISFLGPLYKLFIILSGDWGTKQVIFFSFIIC